MAIIDEATQDNKNDIIHIIQQTKNASYNSKNTPLDPTHNNVASIPCALRFIMLRTKREEDPNRIKCNTDKTSETVLSLYP